MNNSSPEPDDAPIPDEDDDLSELAVTTPIVHDPASSATAVDAGSWQLPPRYRVVGEIGRGGMGVVLRAIDLDIQRRANASSRANQIIFRWLAEVKASSERFP